MQDSGNEHQITTGNAILNAWLLLCPPGLRQVANVLPPGLGRLDEQLTVAAHLDLRAQSLEPVHFQVSVELRQVIVDVNPRCL